MAIWDWYLESEEAYEAFEKRLKADKIECYGCGACCFKGRENLGVFITYQEAQLVKDVFGEKCVDSEEKHLAVSPSGYCQFHLKTPEGSTCLLKGSGKENDYRPSICKTNLCQGILAKEYNLTDSELYNFFSWKVQRERERLGMLGYN